MTRTMLDAVTVADLPTGAPLYAGYLDGLYANITELRSRFPHAVIVEIVVSSQSDAGQVLDVETFDATPDEAPGWVQRRRAAGVDPSVYCNSSTWPAVIAAFQAAGVAEPHYWIAAYDGDPTIPAGAIAKQWADNGGYDTSSVASFWPGIDPLEPDVPLSAADAKLVAETLLATSMPAWAAVIGPDGKPHIPSFAESVHGSQTADSQIAALAAAVNALAASEAAAKTELDAVKAAVAGAVTELTALANAGSATAAEVQSGLVAGLNKLGQVLGGLK